jgi:uncharacterized protein YdeI (YjbR/CyaY-like superfamily)
MNPKVDLYLVEGCGRCPLGNTPQCKVNKWPKELEILRFLLLSSDLKEDLKWSMPCYTFEGNNILILSAFNDYCALSFFKGALLKDAEGILIQQTENTQATRQVRFTNVQQIIELENILKKYISEAIEIEKNGLKIDFKKITEYEIPEEFQRKMNENPAIKTAFESLTPGRQRGYLIHFSAPKQAKTRESRIENCLEQIFAGKGLND